MSFYALQVSLQQIYYAFTEKPEKLFWTRPNEKPFAFAGNRLKHLESRDILCIHRPETLKVSTGPGRKNLMGQIHCLYNNVIYRLYAATNQWINESREPALRPDNNQLALIRDANVH